MIPKHVKVLGCGLVLAVVTVAAGWPSPALAADPNDPLYDRQWGLRRIGAPEAWKTSQGRGINVAVLDTGVYRRHEDLRNNMAGPQWDFIDNDGNANPVAAIGPFAAHGSLAAGVIAATRNNGRGIAGVAPQAKIMAVRVGGGLDRTFDIDAATEGISWATQNGADVINMSLGVTLSEDLSVPVPWPPMDIALTEAAASGVLLVASAGNEAFPICGEPAIHLAVLCVGASDELDRLADFGRGNGSNYGIGLDVVAPGRTIISTGLELSPYESVQGTSFAAPFVAGVGALLMSMGATHVQAAQIIRHTAKDLGLPGYDNTYGFGRLDAKAAVELCEQIC